ncbi:transcription elongation factor 1 homolog [Benincasa hispida]|uniref:transcription elongation factor 1 homolog n=1 Tax=Benincasa hispida TaxID=102211 RepID=UPI001902203A|nr:transcription elongation factor 1 homolog [Benincasa hispida]
MSINITTTSNFIFYSSIRPAIQLQLRTTISPIWISDQDMGKRKSRAKPPPKKRMDKLDTVFSCPFCNHGTSVECRIDLKNLIGEASCRICQESFSTTITALSEAIDVYSEWIDECERVNNLEDDAALRD